MIYQYYKANSIVFCTSVNSVKILAINSVGNNVMSFAGMLVIGTSYVLVVRGVRIFNFI